MRPRTVYVVLYEGNGLPPGHTGVYAICSSDVEADKMETRFQHTKRSGFCWTEGPVIMDRPVNFMDMTVCP